MASAIKFIHASDLHLDVSISGLTELPKHLVQVLADAPYRAAEKIVDTAIAERVDFVLLAGDLLDLDAGNVRATSFLLAQFQRLCEKDIRVYWVAGKCDHPDRWPGSIELPENVVTFHASVAEHVAFERQGKTVARIVARGFSPKQRSGDDFFCPHEDGFNIALTHGSVDSATLAGQNIHYWALGGRHRAAKQDLVETIAVYPGTPQGRGPDEPGPHGFKICRVDNNGNLRVHTVESDRVRFEPQQVAISEQVQWDELKNELAERALHVMTDTTEQVVLTEWTLSPDGEFNPRIRQEDWTQQVLDWLREEFGQSDKGLWSLGVRVDAPQKLPTDWYEEDTLLGEYLRAIGRYQTDESLRLQLHQYLPQSVHTKVTSGMVDVPLGQREDILRKATLVGVDYLAQHKHYDPELTTEA